MRLSFDQMISSSKSRGTIMPFPALMVNEYISFDILRFYGRTDGNPVLVFVAIPRLCEID